MRRLIERPPHERDLLAGAKQALDALDFYPAPVRLHGVRVAIVPWLFQIPGFRRFRGYATRHLILLKGPGIDEALVAHELCHVWQLQHRPLRVWLSYARPSTFSRDRTRYRANRYELEARAAARRWASVSIASLRQRRPAASRATRGSP